MVWVCKHSSGWCNEYKPAETGLYYLGSRYYDPQVGRFINADDVSVIGASPMELTDKNLFAYCDNNPVVRKDDSGQIWNIIIGAAVGAASVYVGDIIGNVISGKSGWDILKPTSSAGTYLGAAVSGMIPGAGLVSMITRPVISTGVKYGIDCGIGNQKFNPADAALDLAVNASGEVLSFGVGKALDKIRPKNYSSFKHQITRQIPKVTQQQTKQIMYAAHRAISASNKMLGFAVGVATNR